MAAHPQRHNTASMLTNTKPIPTRAASPDFAARKFCKARSLAERLGICPRTIFRWADAGKITRYKINPRVVLFSEAEVITFIDSARIGNSRVED